MTYSESLRKLIKKITHLYHNSPHIEGNYCDYQFEEGNYIYQIYKSHFYQNSLTIEVCDNVDPNRRGQFDYSLVLAKNEIRFYDTLNFQYIWYFDYYTTEEELFQASLVEDLGDLNIQDIKDLIQLKSIL